MKPEEIKMLSDQYREEIQAYLDDTDGLFGVGFELMQKFSIKVSIMHMIGRRRDNPLMKQKMDYELAKIAAQDVITISPYADKAIMNKVHPAMATIVGDHKAVVAKTEAETKIVESLPEDVKKEGEIQLQERIKVFTTKNEVKFEELPPEMQKEFDKARRFYHLERHYHTTMKVAESDEARAEALKLCKEYEELNKAAWAIIDQWTKAGKPAPEKPKDQLPADIARAIGSATSYLSRYTSGLESKKGKAYEHLKEMVTKKITILTDNKVAIPEPQVEVLKKHGLLG